MDFPRNAPARGAGAPIVPIRVSLMKTGHAVLWDARIQPVIASTPGRADRLWSWTLFRTFLPLAQKLRARHAIGYCVLVRNNTGRAIPAAMSLLIESYPHLDTSKPPAEATFVWFLASAPDTALVPLGVSPTPRLGETCLDIAITVSVNAAHYGRIGLHAAFPGLASYYLSCGLLRLPVAVSLPVTRPNDGLFFYTDEQCAATLVASYAARR